MNWLARYLVLSYAIVWFMKKYEPPPKPGRKPAKHSNPDYVQMTAYVPRELRNKVKARLAEQEREFSDLVEGMLSDWLAKQKD